MDVNVSKVTPWSVRRVAKSQILLSERIGDSVQFITDILSFKYPGNKWLVISSLILSNEEE